MNYAVMSEFYIAHVIYTELQGTGLPALLRMLSVCLHCKTFRCKFTVKYWQLGCQPHTVFLQDYYCTQHLQFCTVFTKYSIILLYNIFYSIRLLFTENIVIPAFLSVLLDLQN